jgi:hypothetical protein
MNEIVDIQVRDNYQIWVKFSDGLEKVVNIRQFIGRGIAKDLLDYDNFRKVTIEPGGGISWFNGFDVCPNFIRTL